MILLVPNKKNGLERIIENLDKFRDFFHDIKETLMEVWMPHFDFTMQQYCVHDSIWHKVQILKIN